MERSPLRCERSGAVVKPADRLGERDYERARAGPIISPVHLYPL
jgi:hypothetical protein